MDARLARKERVNALIDKQLSSALAESRQQMR
jgi:hypothetical protein